MADASEFKFGILLGFAMSNYEITLKDKSRRGFRLGASKIWGFPLIFMQWLKIAISNVVHIFSLPIRPIIKSHK